MNNYNEYYNWYQSWNTPLPRHINSNEQNLMNPQEGFIKGNMFSNLYNEYKAYQPIMLNLTTEQEKDLYELQTLCFATHDLNLYLDTHPEDQSMVMLFNDYRKKVNKLTQEYEQKYGPLETSSNQMEQNNFVWANSSWPWEEYHV